MRLIAYPGERAPVRALEADAAPAADGGLALRFRLEADPGALRLPTPATPARADGLWRHTCFEAFLTGADTPAYVELNFSPSGEWAAYRFDGYRAGMAPLALPAAPAARWTRSADGLALDVDVPGLVPAGGGSALRVGLAAVIEDDSGTITHWALRHPADRPDFHHPDGFVLALPGR